MPRVVLLRDKRNLLFEIKMILVPITYTEVEEKTTEVPVSCFSHHDICWLLFAGSPIGYVFLLFEYAKSVEKLVDECYSEGDDYFYVLSSASQRNKIVRAVLYAALIKPCSGLNLAMLKQCELSWEPVILCLTLLWAGILPWLYLDVLENCDVIIFISLESDWSLILNVSNWGPQFTLSTTDTFQLLKYSHLPLSLLVRCKFVRGNCRTGNAILTRPRKSQVASLPSWEVFHDPYVLINWPGSWTITSGMSATLSSPWMKIWITHGVSFQQYWWADSFTICVILSCPGPEITSNSYKMFRGTWNSRAPQLGEKVLLSRISILAYLCCGCGTGRYNSPTPLHHDCQIVNCWLVRKRTWQLSLTKNSCLFLTLLMRVYACLAYTFRCWPGHLQHRRQLHQSHTDTLCWGHSRWPPKEGTLQTRALLLSSFLP